MPAVIEGISFRVGTDRFEIDPSASAILLDGQWVIFVKDVTAGHTGSAMLIFRSPERKMAPDVIRTNRVPLNHGLPEMPMIEFFYKRTVLAICVQAASNYSLADAVQQHLLGSRLWQDRGFLQQLHQHLREELLAAPVALAPYKQTILNICRHSNDGHNLMEAVYLYLLQSGQWQQPEFRRRVQLRLEQDLRLTQR